MPNTTESNEVLYLSASAKRNVIADFTNQLLFTGETLSSVTGVTQINGPGTLTLSAGTVNSSDVTVGSSTVVASKGVTFSIDARNVPVGRYCIRVVAVSSTGEVLTEDCRVEVQP